LDKGRERLLSDRGYFGNKTLNDFEQSEGANKRAVSVNNVEHLYIRRMKYGLRFRNIGLMAHVAERSFLD